MALETKERVPRRHPCAGQGAGLLEIQRLWHGNKALLVKSPVLPQCAVDHIAMGQRDYCRIQGACDMVRIETRQDLVAFLEAGNACADGLDCAGAIGAGDNRRLVRLWVLSLWRVWVSLTEVRKAIGDIRYV